MGRGYDLGVSYSYATGNVIGNGTGATDLGGLLGIGIMANISLI